MSDPITVVAYDQAWPEIFGQLATQLRAALAARFTNDRRGYLEARLPIIWDVLRRADQWAQQTGWEPGPSDA